MNLFIHLMSTYFYYILIILKSPCEVSWRENKKKQNYVSYLQVLRYQLKNPYQRSPPYGNSILTHLWKLPYSGGLMSHFGKAFLGFNTAYVAIGLLFPTLCITQFSFFFPFYSPFAKYMLLMLGLTKK